MAKPSCVDLRALLGPSYRYRYEVEREHRTEEKGWPREDGPWLTRVVCHYGEVYPCGGDELQACSVDHRGGCHRGAGGKLLALPRLAHQRGDAEECVVRFHAAHLPEVLVLLKPYRRRVLSEAEREKFRRQAIADGRQPPRIAPRPEPESEFTPLGSGTTELDG